MWLRICCVTRKPSRPLVGRSAREALLKKPKNGALNRKTLQEKAQNLNESQLLSVYVYG